VTFEAESESARVTFETKSKLVAVISESVRVTFETEFSGVTFEAESKLVTVTFETKSESARVTFETESKLIAVTFEAESESARVTLETKSKLVAVISESVRVTFEIEFVEIDSSECSESVESDQDARPAAHTTSKSPCPQSH
jgi:hypothetical protein